jgi:hypothetical protein
VSPKSRGRKKKAGRTRVRPARQYDDTLSEAAAPIRAAAAALYAEAESFRPLLSATDPFAVETHTAQLIARFTRDDPAGAFGLAMGLAVLASRHPEPHVAAMVAAVHHFLPGMAARMAMSDLARAGVRWPGWRDRLGDVTPGRAWRYRDVFGDQEALLVTFGYDGHAEHGLLVEITTCPEPSVRLVYLSTTVEELHAVLRESADGAGGRRVMDEISLVQAAATLAATALRPHRDARPEELVFLPVVQDRLERLPEPEPVPRKEYTREDRAAAVEAFLAETPVPDGVDAAGLRFWARVLAGYTAVSGSPPTRIGPAWLGYALGEHVPRTFALSAEQRAGLVPAVTAWARWAARRRDLPEAAAAQLAARVLEIDEKFDKAYADSDLGPIRCYLSDVVAITADGAELSRTLAIRSHAVPLPEHRPPAVRSLHASDPAQRRRILVAVLESWGLAADQSKEDWLAALTSVSERLWNEEPAELAEAVVRYLEGTRADPGLLGDLTELAVQHSGDEAGFRKAAYARLEPLSDLWDETGGGGG